ncbi:MULTISPECIES: C13 family peptidase [unclassified Moraxella]|uniref:C13 family peptidase n=1 Tax=unclassified Moraxella TaxID=2685852 RepID=UPI003AF65AF7
MPTSLSNLDLRPLQRFWQNVFANLRATAFMLIGSKRAFYWVKPSVWQFLLFAITALASNFLFSWMASDESTYFNQQGLISYLVWPTVMLVAGLILAKRHHNAMLIFVPAILWLVADTFMALLQSLFQWFGQFGWLPEWTYQILPTLFTLLFVWQALSLLWIFGNQLRWSWLERVLIMLGAFAVFSVWQKNVQSEPIFQQNPEQPFITESAFYAQQTMLPTLLNQLAPQRQGVADWYFVGVAGHEQDVFRSEIELTTEMLNQQLGMAGRSLNLINNPMTMQVLPVASKTSIETTLQGVANKMNREEDVLFLTLSSHGADNILEMSNPPLQLDNVDASWLRQTLDKSGIKWRVIVISACYSGSFIDELQSPTTLVITASAKDKSSFGCNNESEFTYFGQAFFAESLPKLKRFLPAFEEAKKSIAGREKMMGFEPSEPQFVIGEQMQKMLPEFEKTLKPIPVPQTTQTVASVPAS